LHALDHQSQEFESRWIDPVHILVHDQTAHNLSEAEVQAIINAEAARCIEGQYMRVAWLRFRASALALKLRSWIDKGPGSP
jgi:hypothetical protein